MAERSYGSRLMRFDFKPEHITEHNTQNAVAKEIAEWYTIGLANQLIVNRMGITFFVGRLSGYSKTAWVYHLKNFVYDVATCKRSPLQIDGNWREVFGSGCGRNNDMWNLNYPQPHVEILHRSNLTFPRHYLSRGRIVVDEGAVIGHEEDELLRIRAEEQLKLELELEDSHNVWEGSNLHENTTLATTTKP